MLVLVSQLELIEFMPEPSTVEDDRWITVRGLVLPQSVSLRAVAVCMFAMLCAPGVIFFFIPVAFFLSPLLFLGAVCALPMGIAVWLLNRFCRGVDRWILELGEKLNAKSIEFRAAIDRSLDHSFGVDAMAASPMSVIDDLVRLSDYGELQRRERERKMTH